MLGFLRGLFHRTRAQRTGARGEDLAAAELARRGYRVLERNFTGRGGEIDIIALENSELVFVEVKTRSGTRFGNPEDAVDAHKAECLARAAMDYWRRKRLRGLNVRCDVVAVLLAPGTAPEITVFRDAVPLRGNFF